LKLPIFGALLEGKNIYTTALPSSEIIVMGNESKGISQSIESLIDEKITIPAFSLNPARIDSLNVSVATAIICSEFRRRNIT
jgi:TrmH family RNA methyltransferase